MDRSRPIGGHIQLRAAHESMTQETCAALGSPPRGASRAASPDRGIASERDEVHHRDRTSSQVLFPAVMYAGLGQSDLVVEVGQGFLELVSS